MNKKILHSLIKENKKRDQQIEWQKKVIREELADIKVKDERK